MEHNGLLELKGPGRGAPGGSLECEALSPSTGVSCLALLYPPSLLLSLPPQSQASLAQKQEPKKGRGLVTHKGSFYKR